MKNPWRELINKVNENYLTDDQKYIIREDLIIVDKFNNSLKSEKSKKYYRIHYDIHPYPYTGNIKSAEVLLLASNPGYVENESETLYKLQSFHKEAIENLEFKNKSLINPDKKRIEFGNYWIQKTEKLKEEVGIGDKIYEKIALVQFFPYHSFKYRKIPKKYFKKGESYLKTQKFTFDLVKSAINKGKIIIILRSKKDWYEAIPELKEYKEKGKVMEIKNYRQPYITRHNFYNEKDYEILVETLKK